MFFLMAHVDDSSIANEILNLEWVVRPPKSRRDTILDDATTRTINPSDLMQFISVLPVPPWLCKNIKTIFFN